MEKEKVIEKESNDHDFSRSRLLRDEKKAEIAKEKVMLKNALVVYLIKEDQTFLESELDAITDLDLLIHELKNAIYNDNKDLKARIIKQIENVLVAVDNAYWLRYRLEIVPFGATAVRRIMEKRMETLINEIRTEFVPDWFVKMINNCNEPNSEKIPQNISACLQKKAKEIHAYLSTKHSTT